MDLNKLRVFYHVAKAGGVKAASLSLKMGQSSISSSVTALEKELGYKLFERHFRGMRLTSEGNILFDSARKILAEVSLAEELIRGEERKEEGQITIATSYGIASSEWFAEKISNFTEKFSRIKIKVIEYKLDIIDSIEADVFICPYIYDRPEFIQEKIKTFEFKLVAGKKYLARYGTPVTEQDLDNHRLLSFSLELKNPFNGADKLLQLGRSPSNPREPFLEINSSIGLLRLVEHNVGIASIVIDDYTLAKVSVIFPNKKPIKIDTYFVYPKHLKNIKRYKVLKEFFLQD